MCFAADLVALACRSSAVACKHSTPPSTELDQRRSARLPQTDLPARRSRSPNSYMPCVGIGLIVSFCYPHHERPSTSSDMNSIDVPDTVTPSTSPPVAADVRAVCHATWTPEGRPSKIHEYCSDTVRKGQNCMWFVRRYGRSTFASYIVIEDIEKGSNPFKLQCFDSWWSRFGFYNIVGVRHVKVCLVSACSRLACRLRKN